MIKIITFLCFLLYGYSCAFSLTPGQDQSPTAQKASPSTEVYQIPILPEDTASNMGYFYKHNLNLNLDQENLARRGEIVFFSSLSYVWVYQFIIMDIMFAAQFNDLSKSGKLSLTNFLYSVFSSILIALMITRKDNQFLQVAQYQKPASQFKLETQKYREEIHEWQFAINFLSYDF